MKKKTIGILGGMGPEATCYFYSLIISRTKAQKDQDHIPTIIYSNPQIPPRTEAILKKGPSPSPLLQKGLNKLLLAGADLVVIPCITAHYFLPEITANKKYPLLNLLDESVAWTKKNLPQLKKVGLISSSGTLKSKLFHHAFQKEGIEVIEPTAAEQQQVMEAIFGKRGIKAGFTSGGPRRDIIDICQKLIKREAEAIIAGCTEVPLVVKAKDLAVPLIEPLKITAEACIIKAGYELRS
ncbi:MAG: aspartate/glutamate racemase family protein [Candidatus Aminicenantales bacterium]